MERGGAVHPGRRGQDRAAPDLVPGRPGADHPAGDDRDRGPAGRGRAGPAAAGSGRRAGRAGRDHPGRARLPDRDPPAAGRHGGRAHRHARRGPAAGPGRGRGCAPGPGRLPGRRGDRMSGSAAKAPSPFRQPRAVYAVAFACVISFMGIGLVDPILPALASRLNATPAQVELLFTSYLVVTAVAMLVTGWISSRVGAKKTLIAGLVLIVAFAGLAGSTNSINGIVGFRAGWGLGNALFIATSLAVIVNSAVGGFSGAIVLYETALGVGIASGPLLGGLLGDVSWRGPFYGVSVLMG